MCSICLIGSSIKSSPPPCVPAQMSVRMSRDGTAVNFCLCRDAAAARDTDVKAAVARLAKLAAITEMQLETLQLQAEGNRIGQLGVSSGGIMGEFGVVHMFCSELHSCLLASDDSPRLS